MRKFLCVAAFVVVMTGLFSCAKAPLDGINVITVAVTGHVPVLDLPARPQLETLDQDELLAYKQLPESVRLKLQGNDKKLKTYAAELQVAIEDYNLYATVRNKKSEDAVGVKGIK